MSVRELEHCMKQLESYTNEIVELMEEPTEESIEAEATKIETDLSEIRKLIYSANIRREQIRRTNSAVEYAAGHPDMEEQVAQLRSELAELRQDGRQRNSMDSQVGSVRLPKLEVEKFDGDVLKFKEFWDHFQVAVGSNRFLKPVEKLNYLRVYLSGEAKRVIAGLTATDENYEVAMSLLQERYGDTQASIDAHYSRLMDLRVASNQTHSIRALLDKIESHLRCLQALDEDTEHRHFISLIMSKLPRELVAHLEETKGAKTPWTVELLRTNLHNVLNAREIAERQNGQALNRQRAASEETSSKLRSYVRGAHRSTTDSFVASEKNPSNKRPATPCIYCGRNNHYHSDCRTINTVAERRDKIRQLRRCFVCLQSGHTKRDCKSATPCYYCKEVRAHHQSICMKRYPTKKPPDKDSVAVASELHKSEQHRSSQNDNECPNTSVCGRIDHTTLATGENVLLQTAQLNMVNPDTKFAVATRALLDSGSNRTYVTKALARQLGLNLQRQECFSVGTFGSEKRKTVNTAIATVQIQLKDGSSKTLDVNVVEKITGAITRVPANINFGSFLNTTGENTNLVLADPPPLRPERSEVGLLIGNDYYLDIVNADRIEVSHGLYLLSSKLGWLVTGRIETEHKFSEELTMFVDSRINSAVPQLLNSSVALKVDKDFPVNINVQDLWRMEAIGIKDSPDVIDDDKAIEAFNSTVKVTPDGRYEVTWPWKDSSPELPQNYQLALGRFKSLSKRLKENQDVFAKYRDVIRDQERLGIIEKVEPHSNQGALQHYIPHHPVVTPGKATTKLRIVYDASAKAHKNALSLNECMYRGPVILEDLAGLLLRFRKYPIVLTSDIEKAFLQIGLQEPERDVTRFLWYKNDLIPEVESNVQVYRFCRVPFGAISSPFLLAATIRHHLTSSMDADLRDKIQQGLYVDNVITGVGSEEDALEFYRKAKDVFTRAKMNLREWNSNSSSFLQYVPPTDKSNSSSVKILGIPWDTTTDTISIASLSYDTMSTAATKRQLLQMIASTFDPLGFFAPILLRAKLLLRQISDTYKEWDAPIGNTLESEWKTICVDIARIPDIKLPRCVQGNQCGPESQSTFQLVCFCDASAVAYAAAVYLKTVCGLYSYVNLVFAKTRLSPSKKTSIPRMELLATLIGSRMLNFVAHQLKLHISAKHLFSDSLCVLYWLKSSKQKPVFVENRLREIKRNTDITFRYIKTSENPADLATRPTVKTVELDSSNWWHGPEWLTQPAEKWPASKDEPAKRLAEEENQSDPSCKRIFEVGCLGEEILSSNNVRDQSVPDNNTIGFNQHSPFGITEQSFSSRLRLYRTTAWALRFISRLRKGTIAEGRLTANEIYESKLKWDRYVQQAHFESIFRALRVGTKCNVKEQLNVQLDDEGLLRCHGRFLYLELPDDRKYPKLLPKDAYYTQLVITDIHERNLHAGVSHTLAQLRHEYWVPQGRATVKKVLRRCCTCKRHLGGPYKLPQMPPYPEARMNKCPAFSYVGLDYLGPMIIKEATSTRKVWLCLFTCMAIRAIHLELVDDMSTERFLMALRRFVARRGKPILIVSNNASQFKLAKDTLSRVYGRAISDQKVKDFVSSNQIAWKFITERAPWMGGFYERLVGSVKVALKKSIGRLLLAFDQLHTCVTEIESIINSRPLTYVGESIEDITVLRPNDFLTLNPRCGQEAHSAKFSPSSTSRSELITSWRRGNAHLTQFWKHWYNGYINLLRERSDFRHRQPKSSNFAVPSPGDVVLVKEQNAPRNRWSLAKVDQIFPGADGQVRSARISLQDGKTLCRPIKLLYPLELASQQVPTNDQDVGEDTHDKDASAQALPPTTKHKKSLLQRVKLLPRRVLDRHPREAKSKAYHAIARY